MAAYGSGGSSQDERLRAMMEEKELFMREMYILTPTFQKMPETNLALVEARKEVEEYIFKSSSSLDWSSIHGNEKAIDAIRDAIESAALHKDLFAHYGMTPSKGVLLWGPPGCGKTLLGKVAASIIAKLYKKDDAEILLINGATLQSPFVGVTEALIVSLFKYAREYKKAFGHPLLIFIDEADAILQSRSSGPRWAVANVSTFLAEMDGVEDSGAFVMLATNRPEEIDEALLRDGRCDRKIKVERPSLSAGESILYAELVKAPLHGAVDVWHEKLMDYIVQPHHTITSITRESDGQTFHLSLANILSGAMLVGLVNRAKGLAFRRDRAAGTITGIMWEDLREAVDEVVAENKGLRHEYALRELIETVVETEKRKGMN